MLKLPSIDGGALLRWTACMERCGAVICMPVLRLVLIVLLGGVGVVPASAQGYRLAAGDTIKITVVGEAEISGEYAIDDLGEITIPLLGTVQVAGMLLTDCKTKITTDLAAGLLNHPVVFVGIANLRPMHVLGDVKTPGVYPYRYGSLMMTAVAQAGGYGRVERTFEADLLLAVERVKSLEQEQDRLVIKRARLEAQLASAPAFQVPENLNMSAASIQTIVDEQRRTAQSQIDAFKRQNETLVLQQKQLAEQRGAVEEQINAEKKQAELIQRRIDGYGKLTAQGLARESTTLELNLSKAAKDGDIWRMAVERSRLRVASIDIDVKMHDVEAAYQKGLLTELDDVRHKLGELAVTLPSARQLRATREAYSAFEGNTSGDYDVNITRMNDDGIAITLLAVPTTRLQPGDIIEVKKISKQSSEKRAGLALAVEHAGLQ